MAIYKPSNFYPNLDELDWSDFNGHKFECQINTDGSTAKAYKIQIFSSSGVLLYEYLDNFSKPIKNMEFGEFKVDLFLLGPNPNQQDENRDYFELDEEQSKYISLDLYDENHILLPLETRQKYNPFCLYNIKEMDVNLFCIYEFINGVCTNELPIYKIDENKVYTDPKFSAGCSYYIGLKNNFDYKWTVRIYENLLKTENNDVSSERNTLISSGYLTGTNQGVIWYNNNSINFQNLEDEENKLDKLSLIDNYVKMNNYIQLEANETNSFFKKNEVKKGFTSIDLKYKYENSKFKFNDANNKLVDFSDVLDNLFVKISGTNFYIDENPQFFNILFKKNEDNSYFCFDKIKFNMLDNSFCFINEQINLFFIENTDYIITFYFVQRKKIYDVGNNLGQDNNINKILLDKEMSEYLKTDYNYSLFCCDNENTNKNFYGTPNGEIQVGRYIRFPTIDRKVFNKQNFPSGSVTTEETITPQGMFVKTAQFENNSYKNSETYIGFNSVSGKTLLNLTETSTSVYLYNQASTIWLENYTSEDDTDPLLNYRLMFYDGGYRMLISKEEYEKSNSSYIKHETTKDYYYLELDVSTGTYSKYGSIVNGKTNNTYSQVIVPSYFRGAKALQYDGKIYFYLTICFFNATCYVANDYSTLYNGIFWDDNMSSMAAKLLPTGFSTIKFFTLKSTNDNDFFINVPIGTNFANYIEVKNQTVVDTTKIPYIEVKSNIVVSEEDYNSFRDIIKMEKNKNGDIFYYYPVDISLIFDRVGINDFKIRSPKINGAKEITDITSDNSSDYRYYLSINKRIEESDLKYNQNYFKDNKNFILYKIIGYDSDTGEIRLENNTYRTLTNTDLYEIWERYEESGESTTEYYTRRLPLATDIEKYLKVGGEVKANLPCLNTKLPNGDNQGKLFVQPNVNMKTDENYNPMLRFETGDIVNLKYIYNENENRDYLKRDKSFDKLDNSQWIVFSDDTVYPTECGSIYSIYNGFIDSTPENYFFARPLSSTIFVKYADANFFKQEDVEKYLRIEDTQIFNNYVVGCLNCVFIGEYYGQTAIKRYRYKLYDANNNLIKDSKDIYSNELLFYVNGLENNLFYTLYLEVEDQLGFKYIYNQQFMAYYTLIENEIKNQIQIKQSDIYNGIEISFSQQDFLTFADYGDIYVYKQKDNELYEYVTKFNMNEDTPINNSKLGKVIGTIDFNIENDTVYNYVFIYNMKNSEVPTNETIKFRMKYNVLKFKVKTCFKQWSISSLTKINDNEYKIVDTWNLKCNLETQEISLNNSNSKWDTMGQYAQVGIGEKFYESSSLSCLLGDVTHYSFIKSDFSVSKKNGYNEKYNNETNNSEKLKQWKNFSRTDNLKLLQDYKGNKWIVQLVDNTNYNINLNTIEQMTTITFNWVEIMSSKFISIIKDLDSDAKDISDIEEKINKLKENWELETDGNVIKLKEYKKNAIVTDNIILKNIEGYSYKLYTYNIVSDSLTKQQGPFENIKDTLISLSIDPTITISVVCETNKYNPEQIIEEKNNCDYLFADCKKLFSIDGINILFNQAKSLNHSLYNCSVLEIPQENALELPQTTKIDVDGMFLNANGRHKKYINISSKYPNFNYELYTDIDFQNKDYMNNIVVIDEKYRVNLEDFDFDFDQANLTIILKKYYGNQNLIVFPEKYKYMGVTVKKIYFKDGNVFNDNSSLRAVILSSNCFKQEVINNQDINYLDLNLFNKTPNLDTVYCKYHSNYILEDNCLYYDKDNSGNYTTKKNKSILVKLLNGGNSELLYGDYLVDPSIQYVGNYAFYNSISIKNILFGIEKQDKGIVLSSNKISFGNYLFLNCQMLNKFCIPTSCSTIAENALSGSNINLICYNGKGTEITETTGTLYSKDLWGIYKQEDGFHNDKISYDLFEKSPDDLIEKWNNNQVVSILDNMIIGDYVGDIHMNGTTSFIKNIVFKVGLTKLPLGKTCSVRVTFFDYPIFISDITVKLEEINFSRTCGYCLNEYVSDLNISSMIVGEVDDYSNLSLENCYYNLTTVNWGSMITPDNKNSIIIPKKILKGFSMNTINLLWSVSSRPKIISFGEQAFSDCINLKTIMNLDLANQIEILAPETIVSADLFYNTNLSNLHFGSAVFKNSANGIFNGIRDDAIIRISGVLSNFIQNNPLEHFMSNATYKYLIGEGIDFEINNQNLNIQISSDNPVWNVLDTGVGYAFGLNYNKFKNIKFVDNRIDKSNELRINIPQYLFSSSYLFKMLAEYVDLGNIVTTIEENAFLGASKMSTCIGIGKLEEVKQLAFAQCSKLSQFIAPNLMKIGNQSFAFCTNLYRFIFGINYDEYKFISGSYIGELAFQCSNIPSIYIPTFMNNIDKNAFLDCSKLQYIEINQLQEDSPFKDNSPFGSNADIYWRELIWRHSDSSGFSQSNRSKALIYALHGQGHAYSCVNDHDSDDTIYPIRQEGYYALIRKSTDIIHCSDKVIDIDYTQYGSAVFANDSYKSANYIKRSDGKYILVDISLVSANSILELHPQTVSITYAALTQILSKNISIKGGKNLEFLSINSIGEDYYNYFENINFIDAVINENGIKSIGKVIYYIPDYDEKKDKLEISNNICAICYQRFSDSMPIKNLENIQYISDKNINTRDGYYYPSTIHYSGELNLSNLKYINNGFRIHKDYKNTTITKISLPKIEQIVGICFNNCTGLTEININPDIKYMENAFHGSTSNISNSIYLNKLKHSGSFCFSSGSYLDNFDVIVNELQYQDNNIKIK